MLLSTCCSRRLFALPLASPSGLMRSITAVTLFLFTVLGATASHAVSFTWTTLDHPNATDTELYAIQGANGEELSDRWEEAIMIKDRVQQIWATLDAEG